MKIFLLATLFSLKSLAALNSAPPKLCTAIRGNGELVFAHWSSLARIVEHYGPIDKLAGGSSAAITLFLYESILKNPQLSCKSDEAYCMRKKSLEISLMLKSLQGYFDYWLTTPELETLNVLYQNAPKLISKLKFWAEKTEKDLADEENIFSLFKKVKIATKELLEAEDLKRVINPELKKFISSAYKTFNDIPLYHFNEKTQASKILRFRLVEAADSIKLLVAGGFDAKNDRRLFFRPGILSFEDIADKFGRIADFYAGYFYKSTPELPIRRDQHIQEYHKRFRSFLHICAPQAQDKSWSEFAYFNYEKNILSNCGRMYRDLVDHYRTQLISDQKISLERKHRLDDKLGDSVFPITAILNENQSQNYKKTYKEYWETSDRDFGKNWNIPYKSLYFGYWGNQSDLNEAELNLKNGPFAELEKSQKMKSLGNMPWKNILAVSPAEPGLSRLKEIPSMEQTISAGGWADLHPTLFLKSLNCENVVYITRINGETVFGQGVVKRLLNLTKPIWDNIDPKGGEKTRAKNNNGDSTDFSSTWARLYNIANPESSISQSIEAADAVWCTDWDSFDIKKGYTPVLDHAYHSKLYIKDQSQNNFFRQNRFDLGAFQDPNSLITLKDRNYSSGWPSYVGCIPL
ncbi:MAG: hypothetical protein H6621_09240 [Halobacteriovoraceae bacterium]|nr:hypothetical protein [Halobacteriovoraceae bacterium]MCB9095239.1 hypothetical protein [Halobacteriovoraceae bacterium]